LLQSFDPKSGTIHPHELDQASRAIEKNFSRLSPANFLAAQIIPNFTRAWRTAAMNQTKARQALVACALEQYWLNHGVYPQTLEALVPVYLATLPADVVAAAPLRYALKDNSHFVLYSVGWNEVDDGGVISLSKSGVIDFDKGDWVWQPN
jgi:hypothetical protein